MPRVVIAAINQTVRMDPLVTPSSVVGLAAEALKTCAAVIIRGQNGRMSLTHCTIMTDPEAIKAEAIWVGEPFKITLVHNEAEVTKSLNDLKEMLKSEICPDTQVTENRIINYLCGLGWAKYIEKSVNAPYGAVSIRREVIYGNKVDLLLTPLPEAYRRMAPNNNIRDAINILNSIFNNTKDVLRPDLTFDGLKFLDHPPVSPELNEILNLTEAIITHRNMNVDDQNIFKALEQIDTVFKEKLGRQQGLKLHASVGTPDRKDAVLKCFKMILEEQEFEKKELDPDVFDTFIAQAPDTSLRM